MEEEVEQGDVDLDEVEVEVEQSDVDMDDLVNPDDSVTGDGVGVDVGAAKRSKHVSSSSRTVCVLEGTALEGKAVGRAAPTAHAAGPAQSVSGRGTSQEEEVAQISAACERLKRDGVEVRAVVLLGWTLRYRVRPTGDSGDWYAKSPEGKVYRSHLQLQKRTQSTVADSGLAAKRHSRSRKHEARRAAPEKRRTAPAVQSEGEYLLSPAAKARRKDEEIKALPVVGQRVRARYLAAKLGADQTYWYTGACSPRASGRASSHRDFCLDTGTVQAVHRSRQPSESTFDIRFEDGICSTPRSTPRSVPST